MLVLYLQKYCEFFRTGSYPLQTKCIKGKRTVIQAIKSSGIVLGFCEVSANTKCKWGQLGRPGMQLETDVLSVLSSPGVGRDTAESSSPRGNPLQWEQEICYNGWANCWPRKRWKTWGFPTNLELKLSCPQRYLMVGWNISLAGSAAQVPTKGERRLCLQTSMSLKEPKGSKLWNTKNTRSQEWLSLFSVLWLTSSAQGQLVVPGRFFASASPRDALM